MTEVNIRTSAAAAGVIVGASAAAPNASGATPSVDAPLSVSMASASIPQQEEGGSRASSSVREAHRTPDVCVEVRSPATTLMVDPEVNAAVYSACRALRDRLGTGYGFVVEEVTDPTESEAEPRLFVFVSMHAADAAAAKAVDEFILNDWGNQPQRVRGIVRIGSEFV